jgi:hypothetical protein
MIVLHTILYGVIAGASALAAAAAAVVLRSEHSRLHGIAFAIGLVATQLILCLLALELGIDALPDSRSAHHLIEGTLQVLLGVALLATAVRVHRHPHVEAEPRIRREAGPLAQKVRARQTAMLDRVGALDTGPVAGAGALLGVGPKRLLLTMLAAATIATADVSFTGQTALVGIYVALATILVWAPVLLAVVWGRRAGDWTASAHTWFREHRATATFVPLLVFGVYFVVVGTVGLVTS